MAYSLIISTFTGNWITGILNIVKKFVTGITRPLLLNNSFFTLSSMTNLFGKMAESI
jgi:hypothetical protein